MNPTTLPVFVFEPPTHLDRPTGTLFGEVRSQRGKRFDSILDDTPQTRLLSCDESHYESYPVYEPFNISENNSQFTYKVTTENLRMLLYMINMYNNSQI